MLHRGLVAALALTLGATAAPARELRFITIEAAPWASRVDAPEGAFPDLVREIERRTGHVLSMSLQSFPRVERDLETGQADCTILMWRPERARVVERGETVYHMPFGVVARRGVKLESYEDLAPLTVSVVRGLTIVPRFDADAALRKDYDKDYASGVRKVVHGRLDAVAGALPTILHLARAEGMGDALGDRLVLSTVPLALQCSRRSPNLDAMAELNGALRAMAADGSLGRILERNHYPVSVAPKD